jgi:hypothetical protein
MSRLKQLIIVALTIMLGACASQPQKPVAFDENTITGSANRVVIQMNKLPATDTAFPGAICLLCIGVARTVHLDLSSQIQSLEAEDLSALPNRLAEVLRGKGAQVTVLDQPVDIETLSDNSKKGDTPYPTKKDFRPLVAKLGADKLLVVDVDSQGVRRPYSSYVPIGAPKAFVSGIAYMVDLKRNTYVWYSSIDTSRSAEGAWNEPPNYPGLTNAYFQVLTEASNSLANELSNRPKATSNEGGKTEATTVVAK